MTETENRLAERAGLAFGRLKEIESQQEGPEKYRDYFAKAAEFVSLMKEQWDFVEDGGIWAAPLDGLQKRNQAVYRDILPGFYEKSYANPSYAAEVFGDEWGRLLAALMAEVRGLIGCVYEQDREGVVIRLELLLLCYQEFCTGDEPEPEEIRKILYWYVSDYSETQAERRVRSQVDPASDFALKIVMESDLSDPRFLYRYGEYVGEDQLRILSFLQKQPPERLKLMADTFTEGYRTGFAASGRDISIKRSVNIRFAIGFEPMIRIAVENFRKMGLETTMYRAGASLFDGYSVEKNGYFGGSPNKQFDFDHREDLALLLDGMLVTRKLECLKAAYERYKEQAKGFGGPAVLEIFGEKDFEPVTKKAAPAYDREQQRLQVEYAGKAGQITNAYIPGDERSYTIIAFPVPDIGQQFEQIFDEIIRINTLDNKIYQRIQQTLIDALDRGTEVKIKGRAGNRTDLTIKLHRLPDPEKQTNFENCVADVNIPVGEVFTSPVLKGTEGILHVKRVFLNGLEYRDLYLVLGDGMVTDYGCSNFVKTDAGSISGEKAGEGNPIDKEAGRKLIEDHILYHHETLPMGEFAVGTNTTAYVAARKYGIERKMPILIAEKTGPHFAFGDTCYSHSEDVPVMNPDGKEMIARDNECSVLREQDPQKAYFNCHTDITIPYDELGELYVSEADGEIIPIIINGRFVLEGTELLNEAFDG